MLGIYAEDIADALKEVMAAEKAYEEAGEYPSKRYYVRRSEAHARLAKALDRYIDERIEKALAAKAA